MRIIKLEEHNEKWSLDFKNEVGDIKGFLSENLIGAYHIGSTAISGLKAKPVIDILLEVRNLSAIDKFNKEFEELGYEAKGEYGIKGRRFFQKGKDERSHHIHIFETGNPEIKRHRLFVEFMNAHSSKAADYNILKEKLANKYRNEPDKYFQGKTTFIKEIDAEALACMEEQLIDWTEQATSGTFFNLIRILDLTAGYHRYQLPPVGHSCDMCKKMILIQQLT